jgi:hypothetical protein
MIAFQDRFEVLKKQYPIVYLDMPVAITSMTYSMHVGLVRNETEGDYAFAGCIIEDHAGHCHAIHSQWNGDRERAAPSGVRCAPI